MSLIELGTDQVIGDYEILSVAGTGGMGIVYKARQQALDRVVALKVILAEIARTAEYRERFLREARLAASVDHPHVVSVYDVIATDEHLALAMQWIDGEDLRHMIDRSGPLEPERALTIVSQLAGALDAVHGTAGLVHRDVKPGNVLIRQVSGQDHAYLTDFGVAKPSDSLDQLTKTGSVVGTTGYLAPEQIRGQDPGPRSDLYALGCLFFEALTGQPPFQADNELALRWAHANDARPVPFATLPTLGTRYDQFMLRALAVEPQQRFASGREFAQTLADAHSGTAASAQAASVAVPHSPTAVGPSTPLPPQAPQPPVPSYGYQTPVPAASTQPRSGNPLALVVLGLVALAGLAVGALAAAGIFSHHTTTTQTITSGASHQAPPHNTSRPPSSSPQRSASSAPSPSPAASPSPAPQQAGRDPQGYNFGPGCSDNPDSSLPGCPDSPSPPNGDPTGSCPNGLKIDSQTTSCGLAEALRTNYSSDGAVTATNADTGQTFTFNCQTGGSGTVGDTICQAQDGASTRYVLWHQ